VNVIIQMIYSNSIIINHELGHDILNLEHGQCGPMMNPYEKEDYTWKEFETDKNMMFTEFSKQ
jgi:hypothetical protein